MIPMIKMIDTAADFMRISDTDDDSHGCKCEHHDFVFFKSRVSLSVYIGKVRFAFPRASTTKVLLSKIYIL